MAEPLTFKRLLDAAVTMGELSEGEAKYVQELFSQSDESRSLEDAALLNRWEKGQWLIGVSSTGEWQAMSQRPELIGKGFVGKSVRDVLRQIRDLT